MFVVLEGIDGSGTTTQVKAVAQALQARGLPVLCTAQPSGGDMGRFARKLLKGGSPVPRHRAQTLALSFAGDRLDHYDREIYPALNAGHLVLCDRYLLSSWVYQSLDLPLDWVKSINRFAPWPDLTLFLDLDAEKAFARVEKRADDHEIYDRLELQKQLAENYRRHATEHRGRHIRTISGDAPIEDLCETLTKEILARQAQIPCYADKLGTK